MEKRARKARGERVTMAKIAARVGVTKMTVSRALRGVGRISPAMRDEIRRTAGRMGYLAGNRGILAAPTHRGSGDLRMSLLLMESPDPKNELSQELLRGLNDRLALCRGRITHIGTATREETLRAWDEHRAHGLVVRRLLPPTWVAAFRRRGPVVYATSNDVYSGVDSVYCAEMRMAALVEEYLARHGHRHVAWYSFFDRHESPEINDEKTGDLRFGSIHGPRYAAWSFVARYNPLHATHKVIIQERDWERDSMEQMAARGLNAILSAHPRPTALVASTVYIGHALLREAQARGLRVPGDLSLIMYGGAREARESSPPLTCVVLPHYNIGRAIPELIERRLADPDAIPVSLQFEATIEDGATVAAPGAPAIH